MLSHVSVQGACTHTGRACSSRPTGSTRAYSWELGTAILFYERCFNCANGILQKKKLDGVNARHVAHLQSSEKLVVVLLAV